jgi:hypothetical protein
MHQHDQWIIYSIGILLSLTWKWQRFCYSLKGTGNPPREFWDSSKEWFELQTIGSQISWGITIGIVWGIGSVIINKVGTSWFLGGALANVPTNIPFLLLYGSLAELFVPTVGKWICSLIPFATFDDLRKP